MVKVMSNKRNNRARRSRRGKKSAGTVMKARGLTSAPLIFPSQFRGRLNYDTLLQLAPAASAVAYNTFRLNSVYDPDYSGVGTAAYGYSALAALYGRYRVLGYSVHISYTNLSTTLPLTVFAVATPVTTVGTGITQILSQRRTWFSGLSTANGNGTKEHSFSGPVGAIYGVPAAQVRNEDDFASVTGNNPNNGIYAHIGAFNNGASAGTLNIQVRIQYDVVWSLPLELS